MKKLFAVLLALTLVLSMGTIALAADGDTTATGTITITNAVADHTYTVYKMLDFVPTESDPQKGVYTIATGWDNFFAGETAQKYFTVTETEAGKKVTLKDGVTTVDADLARAAVDYAKNTDGISPAAEPIEATSENVVFSGLALGYYAVDTSVGTICSLTNTNYHTVLIEKNSTPDLKKKILENGAELDANNVAIGDTVTYKTTVNVGKGLTDYVVHDKMSKGLTFVDADQDGKIDVTVTVDGVAVDSDNYTVTNTGLTDGCTFEIAFNNDYIASLEETKEIEIVYSATLNEDAEVGATGNPNTAKLEYKNEGTVENSKEDIVLTYTTKYVVDKVDGEGNPLAGVGFTLYKYDDTVVGEDKWVPVGSEIKIDALTDGAKAIYTWNGLEEGQYKLVETTVPDGYNKAKDIEFTITCEEPKEVNATTDAANWSDTEADGVDNVAEDADTFKSTVENKTGSLLPETGGIGTTIFYVVGGILMLAALVLLVSKKRMASFA